MTINTKTLAVHSIQANMLGTTLNNNIDNDVLKVLLANGKILQITCINERAAREISNALNYYPTIGKENNSIDMDSEFSMEVI